MICRRLGARAGGGLKLQALRLRRLVGAVTVLAMGLLGLCATPLLAAEPKADAGRTATELYRRQVLGLMEKTWYQYRSQRTEGVGPGWLMAVFDVNRQGQVQNARVAESIGASLALTGLTLRAIRETGLPPMPDEVASALPREDGGWLKVACVAVVSPINPAVGVRPDGSVVPGLAKEGLHLCDLKALPVSAMKENAAAVKNIAPGDVALPLPKAGLVKEESTPRMLYAEQVRDAVDAKWQVYFQQAGAPPGLVNVVFYINPKGGVENMRVAGEARPQPELTDLALRAIKDADIPPMPKEVISTLRAEDGGRMKLTFGTEVKPDSRPLTQMLDEADKELAKRDEKPRTLEPKEDDSPKGRYMRLVTKTVEKKWQVYLHLRQDGMTQGHLKLVFYVNKKGRVEGLKVVSDKDSTPQLTALTVQAILDAELPPMPAEVIPLLPKDDPERLKIEYNVLVY